MKCDIHKKKVLFGGCWFFLRGQSTFDMEEGQLLMHGQNQFYIVSSIDDITE